MVVDLKLRVSTTIAKSLKVVLQIQFLFMVCIVVIVI